MVEDYTSLMYNGVWEVVSRPINRIVVGSLWIYKIQAKVCGKGVLRRRESNMMRYFLH